jgi:hypothetical protein
MTNFTVPPVSYARATGERHGCTRVVILCISDDDDVSWTSWGKTRADCRALAGLEHRKMLEWGAEIRDAIA